MPEALLEQPDDRPEDRPYFVVWRGDGTIFATSDEEAEDLDPPSLPPGGGPPLRWRPRLRREAVVAGPAGSIIEVGKPMQRTMGELRTFAWQTLATGLSVLVVGLAGGWIISRSITRPIAAISRTASAISASNLSKRIETASLDRELLGLAAVLNDTFTRLEAAFVRQSRFTSDASHELRTPLAVIRSHVELALSKLRSADEYRETLEACLRASGRMATLVDGLLTLARADAGKLDLRTKDVDLGAVVDEVVDQYQGPAQVGGVLLESIVADGAVVRGDATFLARIVSNLLSNAIRHTPPGGRVGVTLAVTGTSVVLAVEDSGSGIAAEDQHQIFERFFRADESRSSTSGGTGLGLAICKTLVEAHGGTIRFTSVPEQGSTFEVRLPLAEAQRGGQSMAPPGPLAGKPAS